MKKGPVIKSMQVIPFAGYDSFLLNLSGGHKLYKKAASPNATARLPCNI